MNHDLRLLEAIFFLNNAPIGVHALNPYFPEKSEAEILKLIGILQEKYKDGGIELSKMGIEYYFRTAPDLAEKLEIHQTSLKKLSRAATETLAIIAYHQPITRAEIEAIRGCSLSRGTLDQLMEVGWIMPKGRRNSPGKPVTWGTAQAFLQDFGLETLNALPDIEELKASGMLDKTHLEAIAIRDNG